MRREPKMNRVAFPDSVPVHLDSCDSRRGTLQIVQTVEMRSVFTYIQFHQGPVVQSIISIMSSLRGQLVKCFRTYYQIY